MNRKKVFREDRNTLCAAVTFPKVVSFRDIREAVDNSNIIWRQMLRLACWVIAAKIQMESVRRSKVRKLEIQQRINCRYDLFSCIVRAYAYSVAGHE